MSEVQVIYRTPAGSIRLSLKGDPGDICNAVAEKLGLKVNRGFDARFAAAMKMLKGKK
jgi:hypothetical protein